MQAIMNSNNTPLVTKTKLEIGFRQTKASRCFVARVFYMFYILLLNL